MKRLIHEFTAFEDTGISLMARVTGEDAVNVVQADIATIEYSIFDLNNPGVATASGSLVVADVIFDALQTDARWIEDDIGYNFRWDASAVLFPSGGKTYRIELKFTPSSGTAGVYHLAYENTTVQLLRS